MSLHKAPDVGAGEGVLVQHVSVSGAPPGDQPEYQPDRQTGQDLVPKQAHEAQEAQQGKQRKGAECSLQLLLRTFYFFTQTQMHTYTHTHTHMHTRSHDHKT